MSIYSFYLALLECEHELRSEGIIRRGSLVYCPECKKMKKVGWVEIHRQEIDDVEEMPG
jgi:hypothetical protein